MTAFVQNVIKRACAEVKKIVLPEGHDQRTLEAAKIITRQNIAKLVILGDEQEIKTTLQNNSTDMQQVEVIDPQTSEKLDTFAESFYQIRKSRGITLERAKQIVADPVYFGTMMVKAGLADGLLSGATHASADTIRPALQIIKPAEGFKTISSVFFICLGEKVYIFADCGLVENPTIAQLADIAVSTAITAIQFGIKPKIAMLSYSTKGSASGENAIKVARATERTQERIASLFGFGGPVIVDGELQFDAAFVPEIAARKAPASPLKGQANVFIFPDLGAGNICYKAVQRMAHADAYGPILQGLAKPVNDLSRGCSAEDIVVETAITAVQAQT